MDIKRFSDPLTSTEQGEMDSRLRGSFVRRTWLAALLVLVGFLILLGRMIYLQIWRYDYYRTRSQNNRVRLKVVPPERGIIYDRQGKALSENILRYRVVLSPSQTKNVRETLEQLRGVLSLRSTDIEQFLQTYKRVRRYESAVVKSSITEQERYDLSVQLYRLAGVGIESYYERYYPYGSLLAHVLGYINRINERDLKDDDEDVYRGLSVIGRMGLEKQYEERLRGKSGYQQVETDVNGNLVRVLEEAPAQRGQDLYLSIDVDLQRFIDETLGHYRGSCVAIEPKTGEVLAMVSKPSFDPNLFVRGISQVHYRRLLNDPDSPLYDRALKGRYPPGSVIKPVMNLAGYYYGLFNSHTVVYCSGHYTIPDSNSKRRFHCWNRRGHGAVNGDKALAQSCDIYYYTLGYQMGVERMASFFEYFKIGTKTGVDLPDESSGVMPTRQWKEKRFNRPWYLGDTINASIGQGFVTTTPLQLAYMTALIARDGVSFTPSLLRYVYDPVAQSFERLMRPAGERIAVYREAHWKEVRRSMENVIHSAIGTGKGIAQGLQYRMAGKSGTVQVISFQGERIAPKDMKKEHQDNAMFVAFAPASDPKIALSIVVERGGGGSATAAPMIRKITDYYLEKLARVE
ncbi:MAG: penicillin-binding protein 2 [Cardiobacteriaceae bacterium]|nr:penicillin-binding protein 2 [Cardiobacteriaceae bacterium]